MTAGCLIFAVKDIDWQEVITHFSRARYATIPLYLLFLWLFFYLKAIRWAALLKPIQPISASQVAGPMMVGFMGNNILPAHLGEIFRVVLLSRQEKMSGATIFSSVAIERILDVLAVMLLVSVGMLGVRELPPAMQQAFIGIGSAILIGFLILIAGLIWLDRAVALTHWFVRKLPVSPEWQTKLTQFVASLAEGVAVLREGRRFTLLMLNSLAQWGCNCVMIYISLWAFGVEAPFSATLILLGVLVFAVTIPSSPGFFGAIELGFVKTLALFGVSEGSAFAVAIYYHLIQYFVVTGIGFWYLARSGSSLSRLQGEAEAVHAEAELEEKTAAAESN